MKKEKDGSRSGGSPSIPGNFFFASLSGFLNIFVPILTYPYIARVLGAERLGILGIAGALGNYFIVAALLGLPIYGVRAIAKVREDRIQLSRTSGELILLGIYAALAASLAYILTVAIVPGYRSERLLFLIFGLTIPAAAMNIEWLFQGLERFRFIGLRNLLIKAIFVVALFLFVKRQEDYLTYALLFSLASVANAIINLRSSRGLAAPAFAGARPSRHLSSMAIFSLFLFMIAAYTNLDLLFLGFLSDNREAGLYSVAIRLVRMMVALSTTLSLVLLPRLSALVDDDPRGFSRILSLSSSFSLMFSLPVGFGLWAVADDLARVFAGPGYSGVADSLRIAAFIVPVATASNFLQMQILVPRGQEKRMLFSFGAGLAVAAAALALLVKPYGHLGAAAAMLAGEIAVLIVHASLCGKKELKALGAWRPAARYLGGALLSAGAASLPRLFMGSGAARLLVSILFGVAGYASYLFAIRDRLALRILSFLARPRGDGTEEAGERIKVLHVINSLGRGGAEKLLSELLPRLGKRGFECRVLALDGRDPALEAALRRGGVTVKFAAGANLGAGRKAAGKAKSAFSPLRVFSIVNEIRRFDPAIVHAHLAPSFQWCAAASLFARKPRFVTTEHAAENRRMGMPMLRSAEKWCYGRYDTIIGVSESVAEAMGDWLGFDRERISIVPNGIPLERFGGGARPAAEVEEWLAGRTGVAMVARFVPAKDHGTALRAIAALPNAFALVLVGDGPAKFETERNAWSFDLASRCLFLGERGDIPEILAACGVYLQSSRKEGFGIAALEAMAAGLPVVAAAVPGLRPLVEGAGLLFPEGDATAAARRILELEEPRTRAAIVAAGKERAKRYSIEVTAAAYADLYRSPVSRRRAGFAAAALEPSAAERPADERVL